MSLLLKSIRNSESIALSDKDIHKVLENIKIIPYHLLPTYTRLEELLFPHNRFILLLESKFNSGHYVSIIYHATQNVLEFYDSYGKTHHELIEKLHWYTHKDNTQELFLDRLFKQFQEKTQCNIIYNKVAFQFLSGKINTCGRWAVFRCILSEMNMKQFNKEMVAIRNHYNINYDELITMLTLTMHI